MSTSWQRGATRVLMSFASCPLQRRTNTRRDDCATAGPLKGGRRADGRTAAKPVILFYYFRIHSIHSAIRPTAAAAAACLADQVLPVLL